MKNAGSRIKQHRPATLIAMLALFVILGGSATAASGLINGKTIKKGTITAKQIKNKTITKGKLKPALVKSLKGKTGPQGAKGAKGDAGAAGADGADGVVSPVYAAFDSVNLTANVELAIGTLALPAGKYMVTGTANVFSIGTAIVGCGLSSGGEFSESATWNSPVAGSRNTVPMQMITVDNATQVTLACHPGNANGSASGTILATPVK